MKAVSRRLTCGLVAAAMLLANTPTLAPLNALKKTDATDSSILGDTSSSLVIPSSDCTHVSTMLSSSPVMFIENVGQFADGARFQVRGGDRTIWLGEDAIWVTVLEKPDQATGEQRGKASFATPIRDPRSEIQSLKGVNLKLSFAGANPKSRIEPFDRLDTHVSYFIGNDPDKWHPDVPVWGGVRYVDLYPGINLEITGKNGQTAPRIVVHSNANPSVVRLQVEGADALALDSDYLRLTTTAGEFSLPLLQVVGTSMAYPTITGNEVASPFAPPHPYNPRSAIQNPQSSDLPYATFLGENSDNVSFAIAVDGNGAAYVTGGTRYPDFSTTPGAFDTTLYWSNVFVIKLNAAGSALAYAAYLGGYNDDRGYSIAVDQSGAAFVTGLTYSSDFPSTSGAFDTTFNGGGTDAFAAKLNAAGSALVYATFLGGSGGEGANDIAVDRSGAAFVTGNAYSSDFPTTPGAFDTTVNGADHDAFVVKLNASGSALAYATFLGGILYDSGESITVDVSGAAYVTGPTESSNFPTTPGAFDTTHDFLSDAFVAKLNTAGSALVYATFLGGNQGDNGLGIAIEESGAAFITGLTYSSDFPTTPGAFDTTYIGYGSAFVAKLNTTGSALLYSTFLGGSNGENAYGIAVDKSGAAFVAGVTHSSDFPTTPGAFDTTYNGATDAFVVKLNASGSALAYSTYLGGSDQEWCTAIAIDRSGTAFVTGETPSSDFPTTPGAFDTTHNGADHDAFVAKIPTAGAQLTILKQVTPSGPRAVNWGDLLTYTVQIITPTNGALVFYDRVPTFTTYLTDSLDAPTSVDYYSHADAISGTLNLTATVPVTVSFAVRVVVTGTADLSPLIANRACVHPTGAGLADCLWSNEVWNFTYVWAACLPIILHSP